MQRILTYILIKIVDIGSMRRLNTNCRMYNIVGRMKVSSRTSDVKNFQPL